MRDSKASNIHEGQYGEWLRLNGGPRGKRGSPTEIPYSRKGQISSDKVSGAEGSGEATRGIMAQNTESEGEMQSESEGGDIPVEDRRDGKRTGTEALKQVAVKEPEVVSQEGAEDVTRHQITQATEGQRLKEQEEPQPSMHIIEQALAMRVGLKELDMNVGRGSAICQDTQMVGKNGKWKRVHKKEKSGQPSYRSEKKENLSSWGHKREWQQMDTELELQQDEAQKKKRRQAEEYKELEFEGVQDASPKWPQVIQ